MRTLMPMVFASLVGLASPALASPEEEARVLLIAWSEAYAARDHTAMAELHSPLARIRAMDVIDYAGREAISEYYYFDAHRAKAQSVDNASYDCQVFNGGIFPNHRTGLCFGTYSLTQTFASGETRVRPARFSMALVIEDNRWMIYDHHTSWLPAVVADCGTSVPPDKAALASSTSDPAASALCSDTVKTGSLGPVPHVVPVGATMVAPAK